MEADMHEGAEGADGDPLDDGEGSLANPFNGPLFAGRNPFDDDDDDDDEEELEEEEEEDDDDDDDDNNDDDDDDNAIAEDEDAWRVWSSQRAPPGHSPTAARAGSQSGEQLASPGSGGLDEAGFGCADVFDCAVCASGFIAGEDVLIGACEHLLHARCLSAHADCAHAPRGTLRNALGDTAADTWRVFWRPLPRTRGSVLRAACAQLRLRVVGAREEEEGLRLVATAAQARAAADAATLAALQRRADAAEAELALERRSRARAAMDTELARTAQQLASKEGFVALVEEIESARADWLRAAPGWDGEMCATVFYGLLAAVSRASAAVAHDLRGAEREREWRRARAEQVNKELGALEHRDRSVREANRQLKRQAAERRRQAEEAAAPAAASGGDGGAAAPHARLPAPDWLAGLTGLGGLGGRGAAPLPLGFGGAVGGALAPAARARLPGPFAPSGRGLYRTAAGGASGAAAAGALARCALSGASALASAAARAGGVPAPEAAPPALAPPRPCERAELGHPTTDVPAELLGDGDVALEEAADCVGGKRPRADDAEAEAEAPAERARPPLAGGSACHPASPKRARLGGFGALPLAATGPGAEPPRAAALARPPLSSLPHHLPPAARARPSCELSVAERRGAALAAAFAPAPTRTAARSAAARPSMTVVRTWPTAASRERDGAQRPLGGKGAHVGGGNARQAVAPQQKISVFFGKKLA